MFHFIKSCSVYADGGEPSGASIFVGRTTTKLGGVRGVYGAGAHRDSYMYL